MCAVGRGGIVHRASLFFFEFRSDFPCCSIDCFRQLSESFPLLCKQKKGLLAVARLRKRVGGSTSRCLEIIVCALVKG